LVVTELVSIVSEKVTETFDVNETEVSPSEGELDDTVGDVVSVVVVVSLSEVVVVVVLSLVVDAPSSLLLLQEMMVKLKRNMEKMMSICLTWFLISGLGEPKLYQNMWCFIMCIDLQMKSKQEVIG
jgi:hypothetical protein